MLALQAITPAYDALLPKVDTLISLLFSTLNAVDSNNAVAIVASAMQALLGFMEALTTMNNLNTESILAVYGEGTSGLASYKQCISSRVPTAGQAGILSWPTFSFNVTTPSVEAQGVIGGLLGGEERIANMGTANDALTGGDYSSSVFDGYSLARGVRDFVRVDDKRYKPKFAGTKGNAVFGGLLLHQVRYVKCGQVSSLQLQCSLIEPRADARLAFWTVLQKPMHRAA